MNASDEYVQYECSGFPDLELKRFRRSIEIHQARGGCLGYAKIKAKLDAFNPPGYAERVRASTLHANGFRGDETYETIRAVFKKLRINEYEMIPIIATDYYDFKPPVLAEWQINQLLLDFSNTQSILCKLQARFNIRTSSLNTQFRLYKHLQARGYPCFREHFHLVENHKSRKEHAVLWQVMCEVSGKIPYIPCADATI